MSLYSLIVDNKFALEIVYAFAISIICAIIVLRADKFFRLSLHKGIRYFRNAFLFYGVAFIGRYILGVFSDLSLNYVSVAQVAFEYFILMAGFFLLYSLVWKKVESAKDKYTSSLVNSKIIVFHIMALVIAVLDGLWQTYSFLFVSEILIFFFISTLAYINFINDKGRHRFPGFYFFISLIGLAGWVLNFLAQSSFAWNQGLLIDIGIINIIFFLLFLYGVIRVTKQKKWQPKNVRG
jgi:hypothetical protein